MSPREHPLTLIEVPPLGERGLASPTLSPPSEIEQRPRRSVHPQWSPPFVGSPQTWGPFACVCRSATHRTAPLTSSWATKIHHRLSYIETYGYGNQLKLSLSCGVRFVACHVQVALLWSFLALHGCQRCSDWYALGWSEAVAFGCVCSSHVSGMTSVEVFAAVPLGVSCFRSCRVGGCSVVR